MRLDDVDGLVVSVRARIGTRELVINRAVSVTCHACMSELATRALSVALVAVERELEHLET